MSDENRPLKAKLFFLALALVLVFSTKTFASFDNAVMRMGDQNEHVKELNAHLKDLDLLKGEVTDKFTEETEEIVRKLQTDANIAVDGIFGPASHKVLKKQLREKIASRLENSFKGQMNLSDKGVGVSHLQQALSLLGYIESDQVDDIYGKNVSEAVKQFQKDYSLAVDGVAGVKTYETILKALRGEIEVAAGSHANSIIEEAMKHLGKPYAYGASNGSSFDCSGFVMYVYKQLGFNLPRCTVGQSTVGETISRNNLKVGDIVVFSNTYMPGPSHTGIYVGDGKFIHASSSGQGVIISDFTEYYSSRFTSGRRLGK